MKYVLTDYQEVATEAVVRALRRAIRDYADQEFGALNLTAPTGSGKTVMATAAIERLLYGDDTSTGDPQTTVLWLTDDPSLNEQTRRKMQMSSSLIKDGQLETIDASFDQECFDGGKVYFLNIQKLGKATGYVKGGTDKRKYSLWTTLANTVKMRGQHLIVVIDEAHRGAKRERDRPTIVSRIISDPDGVVPPVPVVWGITATPERFEKAIDASNPSRTRKDVRVPPEDVRESGLIKDKVLIKHKADTQPGDATLGYMAVEDLKQFDADWEAYAEAEDEPRVRPVLAIQVKAKASEADLADLLASLHEGWSVLRGDALAHTFQSHAALSVKGQVIRYIAPQDIEDDQDVRVVLFKEALTTGWDCPRAEVMLSYRRAEDDTYIAQLIGRMVRTPLAKRIMTTDVLNTVALYLPHFNEEQVQAVIEKLAKDPDAPPTEFEKNSIECKRNSAIGAEVVDCLKGLPTYVVPGRAHRSQVARLHTLATRLAGDGIIEKAIDVADAHLIATVQRERTRLAADGTIDRLVKALSMIDYGVIEMSLLEDDIKSTVASVATHVRNIDDLLRSAGRGLRDGLANRYWAWLVDQGEDPTQSKLITAALAGDPMVVTAVETAAEERVQGWLKEHSRAISGLTEARKGAYQQIRQQARASEQFDLVLPSVITASADDKAWERHIFSDASGRFPAKLTGWEAEVLAAELNPDQDLVAWYRNPTGGDRCLRVPYKVNAGEYERPMYPDFIFFHRDGESVVPSIVDPHQYALADTGPKWRGLALYAEEHGGSYARIDAVIKDTDGMLLRLDLKDPTVKAALDGCNDKDDILAVFQAHGGAYA